LEQIKTILTKELKYADYKENGIQGAQMMGLDVSTVEGNYEAESHALFVVMALNKQVNDLIFSYKVRMGKVPPPKKLSKGSFQTRKAINGQLVVETYPSFPGDESPLLGKVKGEVWMDPAKVKDESQVEAFNFEKAWNEAAGEDGGLMLVLGAGNQPALTPVDILQGMFVRNYVVYMKQHPLRDYVNDLMSVMFAPLIAQGYLDLELHKSNERSAALVYHPSVTAVHLTGGKATHDMLVWGVDPQEREKNLKAKTPKLKATMTSELGAVSPWVVVPGTYTRAEMESQAKMIAAVVHANASCNCNSPKCLVVAEDWDQKDEFLQIIEDSLANHILPVAYYPGIEARWQNFANQYPGAKKIESATGLGVEERHLSPAKFSDKPLLLPYLQIKVDVDLDSAAGKEAASKEYAFNNEPFAPMYTIATLKGTSQKDIGKFGKTASTFCNEYLFGTLSGSVTSPPSLLEDEGVETLIAEMRYGSLGVNVWGGLNYLAQGCGQWGAFPGETLDSVQSGIGKIGNLMAMPDYEKFVMRSPIVSSTHLSLKDDLGKEQSILEAVNKFTLDGSIGNLVKLLSAVTGVNLMKVALAGTSVLVAGLAYFVSYKKQH